MQGGGGGGALVKRRKKDHINVFEVMAIFLGLKALCGTESNTHVQLYCGYVSSRAYIQHFWERKDI